MLLSLKGKLVHSQNVPSVSSAYNDLVEALAAMGYDRRAAAEALAKADAGIDSSLAQDVREKLLFKEAIVYLSGT